MGYAFISYSSKNQASADAMRNLLNAKGIETWMAPGDIPPGSEYAEVLFDALAGCSCLVLMLTNNAQESPWVKKEIGIAISNGKAIIPVKVEDVELNSSMKLYLHDCQMVPVLKIDERSEEIGKIIQSVRHHVMMDTKAEQQAALQKKGDFQTPTDEENSAEETRERKEPTVVSEVKKEKNENSKSGIQEETPPVPAKIQVNKTRAAATFLLDERKNRVAIGGFLSELLIFLPRNKRPIVVGAVYGDLKDEVEAWNNIVMVAAGKGHNKHVVGLKKDGTVVAAGSNEYGQCKVDKWKRIKSIFAGRNMTFGITFEGRVLFAGQAYDLAAE